jgi:Family of unknown function (DUF6941)
LEEPIETRFAFLCDAAQESGGKVHALGVGIDRLSLSELPSRVARFVVVIQLSYLPDEAGTKLFTVRAIDADGNDVLPPVNGEMPFREVPDVVSATMNVIVNLDGVTFARFGPHEISVAIDGNRVATLPLEVVRTQS